MKIKTPTLKAVCFLLTVLLLGGVACRENEITSPSETAVPPEIVSTDSDAESVAEPIPITFAAPAAQRSQYEIAAALFNRQSPDIVVEVVPLSLESDPATQADTAVLAQSPTNVQSLVNLSERLENSNSINPEDYFDNVFQGCQTGETAYGLPLSISPYYIYYDPALFAEMNVPLPSDGWDWADLVQTITDLSSGDGSLYGFGGVDDLLRLLQPILVANLDADGTLDGTAVAPYLQDIANMVANQHVTTAETADLVQLINSGQIGLLLGNPHSFSPPLLEHIDGLERLLMPTLGNLAAANLADVACLTISRGSSQPEAAWQWILYLAFNPPPELPANTIAANRLLLESDESSVFADELVPLAVNRVWFSSRLHTVEAQIPALREHVVSGVPLDEALALNFDNVIENSEAENDTPLIATPEPSSGPTVIRFFGDEFRLIEAVDDFNQTHPDIFVNISSELGLGDGGIITMADVAERYDCFSWGIFYQAPPDLPALVWDLTSLVSPAMVDDYAPALLNQLQIEDALYGLPQSVSSMVVHYDEDRFREAGVPLPAADWTFDEMLETAVQFGQVGDDPAYGVASLWFLWQFDTENLLKMLLREQAITPWDVAAGSVNVTDPAVTAVIEQYIEITQTNTFYVGDSQEGFDEQRSLVDNGSVAMWFTHSADRPIVIGSPEVIDMLPLPQFNGRVLPMPSIGALFISSEVEDPTPCLTWLEFLTARSDAVNTMPARQSVANGRTWQNQVGPANAAVYLESLTRHLAASSPEVGHSSFGVDAPLYGWLVEATISAAAGGDLTTLLAEAQTQSEAFLACLANDSAATDEAIAACIQQVDPE